MQTLGRSEDAVAEDFANLSLTEETGGGFQEDSARKIFVGGLSWMTTEEGLRHYLESLDLKVERVTIMRDKILGRSRGFGFVILSAPEDVDKAVRTHLYLDGRKVEAKRAIPKQDMDNHAKKVFVGGIPISLSSLEFRKYFENFGKILETQIMTDRESGRSRGFGFVTYENESVAEKVLKTSHTIHGKPVEVKRAEPKKLEQTQQAQQPQVLMHVPPLTPTLYVPGFPYPTGTTYGGHQAVYASPPVAYDPGYFVSAQGGLMYLPQHYEPLGTMDPEAFITHSPYRVVDMLHEGNKSHPQARRDRPSSSASKGPKLISLEKKDSINASYGYNLSPFPAIRVAEGRTERAVSAPYQESVPITLEPGGMSLTRPKMVSQGGTQGGENRKKRSGSQPPVVVIKRQGGGGGGGGGGGQTPSSNAGTRRTDLNWRNMPVPKSPVLAPGGQTSNSPQGGSVHKYLQ